MANPHRETNSNQAVYEQHSPYEGPIGLQHGSFREQNQDVIALHPNSDGSLSGVTEDGTVVWMPNQGEGGDGGNG